MSRTGVVVVSLWSRTDLTPTAGIAGTMAEMPNLKPITVRLSPAHRKLLERLAAKLGIGKNDILRLALTRLAEAERLLPEERR